MEKNKKFDVVTILIVLIVFGVGVFLGEALPQTIKWNECLVSCPEFTTTADDGTNWTIRQDVRLFNVYAEKDFLSNEWFLSYENFDSNTYVRNNSALFLNGFTFELDTRTGAWQYMPTN